MIRNVFPIPPYLDTDDIDDSDDDTQIYLGFTYLFYLFYFFNVVFSPQLAYVFLSDFTRQKQLLQLSFRLHIL